MTTDLELSAEAITRSTIDNSHQNQITSNANNISQEITNRNNAIAAEVTARTTADSNIQSQVTSNTNNISSEITNRTDADTLLQNQINNNKSRANHNGTQLSSTISDFTTTVLATILTGISFATGTPVIATDSILVATGKLQKQITDILASVATNTSNISGLQTSKYDASNPAGYESASQLNSRDTANRNRANHTGTQLASTVSNLASTVLETVLTGLSTATSAVVNANDTIFAAIGKLQAQINTLIANINNLVVSRITSQTAFATASTTYVVITGFTLTPTVAGTYIIDYGLNLTASMNNAVIKAQLFKNNVAVLDSEAAMTGRSGTNDIINWGSHLQFNGTTDNVEVRVNISLGVLTVNNRRLRMIRVGP